MNKTKLEPILINEHYPLLDLANSILFTVETQTARNLVETIILAHEDEQVRAKLLGCLYTDIEANIVPRETSLATMIDQIFCWSECMFDTEGMSDLYSIALDRGLKVLGKVQI